MQFSIFYTENLSWKRVYYTILTGQFEYSFCKSLDTIHANIDFWNRQQKDNTHKTIHILKMKAHFEK